MDLAVIAVPADAVLGVARECAAKGVRALVVLSAGFAEAGARAAARQRGAARRLPRRAACASSARTAWACSTPTPTSAWTRPSRPVAAARGRVGFLSQSGALGDRGDRRRRASAGIGLSSFVSVGDKADLSGNDFLRYWEQRRRHRRRPALPGVLRQPAQVRAASPGASAARKPIVARQGAGARAAGARAAASHTGALLAASDVDRRRAVRAGRRDPHRHAGRAVRRRRAAGAPAAAGRAPGRRSSRTRGGPGILCADACEAGGPAASSRWRAPRRTAARRACPRAAAVGQPGRHDRRGHRRSDFERAIDAARRRPATSTPSSRSSSRRSSPAPAEVAGRDPPRGGRARRDVPVLAVFIDAAGRREPRGAAGRSRPTRYPEDAARALGRAARLRRVARARRRGRSPELEAPTPRRGGGRASRGRSPTRRRLADARRGRGAARLLRHPARRSARAATAAEAAAAAPASSAARSRSRRSPAASCTRPRPAPCALGLTAPTPSRAAAARWRALAARRPRARRVPRPADGRPGRRDARRRGRTTRLRPGGRLRRGRRRRSSCWGTSRVRLDAADRRDAREMVRALRTFPLLDGYRGAPPADVGALEDVLCASARWPTRTPRSPSSTQPGRSWAPDGAVAVDARMRLTAARRPARQDGRRR